MSFYINRYEIQMISLWTYLITISCMYVYLFHVINLMLTYKSYMKYFPYALYLLVCLRHSMIKIKILLVYRVRRCYDSCARALRGDRVWNRLPVWQELSWTSIWPHKYRAPWSPRIAGKGCIWATQVYACSIQMNIDLSAQPLRSITRIPVLGTSVPYD